MPKTLRWGLLACGKIAHKFADGLADARHGELVAVASRSLDSARAFAAEHGDPRPHGSYESLIADPEVDVIYVATPHPMHAEWAIACARGGKGILCEKPLTLNRPEAEAVVAAAREHDVFLMEAFMYRCHPQTRKLVELVRERAIGDLRLIDAAFSFNTPFNADSRLFAHELGGGGIMDVGCYPVSMARLLAGAAAGAPHLAPVSVQGSAQLGPTGVDHWAAATLAFQNGVLAQLACGLQLPHDNILRLYGSAGRIEVPSPWFIQRHDSPALIHLIRDGHTETVEIPRDRDQYALEADHIAEHFQEKQAPAMPWTDTLENIATLDLWRAGAGVAFGSEPRAPACSRAKQLAIPTDLC